MSMTYRAVWMVEWHASDAMRCASSVHHICSLCVSTCHSQHDVVAAVACSRRYLTCWDDIIAYDGDTCGTHLGRNIMQTTVTSLVIPVTHRLNIAASTYDEQPLQHMLSNHSTCMVAIP